MKLSSTARRKSLSPCVAIALASMVAACGKTYSDQTSSNPSPTNPPPPGSMSVISMQGSWVFYFLSASATTNGLNTSDGTYTLPAACGFPAEHGTFDAYQSYPEFMKFSGTDIYHGKFNGGTDSIRVSFASDASGFELTATGTDNGAPFTLSGSTIGFSMTLTGAVSGHNVVWFGLYDPLYNTFLFCDADAKSLGSLSENPNSP